MLSAPAPTCWPHRKHCSRIPRRSMTAASRWAAISSVMGSALTISREGALPRVFSLAPAVNADLTDFNAANAPFPGGAANPLNYPAQLVVMGNGQGFSSEKPAFWPSRRRVRARQPYPMVRGRFLEGETESHRDIRTRYVHDTGRTDSDLGPIGCNQG